jgi:hypothetical protein
MAFHHRNKQNEFQSPKIECVVVVLCGRGFGWIF